MSAPVTFILSGSEHANCTYVGVLFRIHELQTNMWIWEQKFRIWNQIGFIQIDENEGHVNITTDSMNTVDLFNCKKYKQ